MVRTFKHFILGTWIALALLAGGIGAFSAAAIDDGDPPIDFDPTPPPTTDLLVVDYNSGFDGRWFVTVTVKNRGTVKAGAFATDLIAPNGSLIARFNSTGLAGGVSQTFKVFRSQCEFAGSAVVDSTKVVAETNETNNRKAINLIC